MLTHRQKTGLSRCFIAVGLLALGFTIEPAYAQNHASAPAGVALIPFMGPPGKLSVQKSLVRTLRKAAPSIMAPPKALRILRRLGFSRRDVDAPIQLLAAKNLAATLGGKIEKIDPSNGASSMRWRLTLKVTHNPGMHNLQVDTSIRQAFEGRTLQAIRNKARRWLKNERPWELSQGRLEAAHAQNPAAPMSPMSPTEHTQSAQAVHTSFSNRPSDPSDNSTSRDTDTDTNAMHYPCGKYWTCHNPSSRALDAHNRPSRAAPFPNRRVPAPTSVAINHY